MLTAMNRTLEILLFGSLFAKVLTADKAENEEIRPSYR